MNFRKIAPLMLAGVLTFSQGVLAKTEVLANELVLMNEQSSMAEAAPFWLNINSITTTLSISDAGTASGNIIISGASGTTSIKATYKLEQKSGSSWSTVQTWTDSTSATRLTSSVSRSNVAKGTYRLSVTTTVVRNGVSETTTVSSSEKTY